MAPRNLPGVGLQAFAAKGEENWDTWTNANWRIVSALLGGRVKGVVATLPATPVWGDIYILSTGATAATNRIAVWDNGAWVYITPQSGWRFYNDANKILYVFRGDIWVTTSWFGNIVISPDGAAYPNANGEVTFASYAQNTLTILRKGTDGKVRSVTLTMTEPAP